MDVDQIRLPSVVLVQRISVELDSQLAKHRGVKRVIGTGGEHVLSGIDQRSQANVHRLTHALDALARGFGANCAQRFLDARRWRVAVLTIAHCLVHRFDQVLWSLEIEVDGVADIQRKDLVTLLRYLVGYAGQITDSVTDVFQTSGGSDFAGLRDGHWFTANKKIFNRRDRRVRGE